MAVMQVSACCVFFVVAFVPGLGAQELTELQPKPSCTDCRIELDRLVLLGSPTDSFSFDMASDVVLDGRGFYHIAPVMDRGRIVVYDSSGGFLRVFGAPGPGPRELSNVGEVAVGPRDSVHVFHRGRHTVFSPSYEFVRTSNLPGRVGKVVFLGDGRMAVTGAMLTRDRAGYPLHILQDDSITSSFGATSAAAGISQTGMNQARHLAIGIDGALWMTHYNRYRIERWTTSGELIQVIDRDVRWFRPWSMNGLTPARDQPKLGPIEQDADGLLWVILAVRDEDYQPLRTRRGQRMMEQPAQTADIGGLIRDWDTIIEVIDPENGVLVVTQRLDGLYRGFVAPGVICKLEEGPVGEVVLDVYRLRLRRD